MNSPRIKKYGRLYKFQQQKFDLLKQQLAAQQAELSELNGQLKKLMSDQVQVQDQRTIEANSLMFYQQIELASVDIQRRINRKKIEIATADEKLDHLLHTFREQNQKLKSSEKLIEQETKKLQATRLLIEMLAADERYLATHFVQEPT